VRLSGKSFGFARVAVAGVLADQLAAGCYLNGRLLIAADWSASSPPVRQDPGAENDGLNTSALARCVQAGKTRRCLYLEPALGGWLCPVLKLDGE
jgi:hypothetical protein